MGWNHEWYERNKERIAERNRKNYAADPEFHCKRAKAWRQANPDKVKMQKQRHTAKYIDREIARIKAWKAADPERHKASGVAYHRREKQRFIDAFGGRCECCGESYFELLTLDHVKGRGNEERKQFGRRTYARARVEGYPRDKYRLLCMSCNFSFGVYGYCPHQKFGPKLVSSAREQINEAVA